MNEFIKPSHLLFENWILILYLSRVYQSYLSLCNEFPIPIFLKIKTQTRKFYSTFSFCFFTGNHFMLACTIYSVGLYTDYNYVYNVGQLFTVLVFHTWFYIFFLRVNSILYQLILFSGRTISYIYSRQGDRYWR